MSWLKTGFAEMNKEAERREQSYGVPEVWLKTGEYRDLLFVDGEPSCVNRHTAYLNGEYHTFTCLGDTGATDIPCCEIMGTKKNRNFTGNYTVVDITPYKDKQSGEQVVKPALKLYSAKYKTLQILKARQEDGGTLVGKVFRVRRTGEKSVSTGDDISFLREADMAKAFASANYKGKSFAELVAKETEKLSKVFSLDAGEKTNKLVPLNYFQVLHPKKPAEIRQLLRGWVPKDAKDDDNGPAGSSDSVPF